MNPLFTQCEISHKGKFHTIALQGSFGSGEFPPMPKRRSQNPHTVYKFLRLWRKSRKFTQGQLAEQIGTGISTISGWENGDRQVDLSDLAKLAAVYGVHPAALLFAPEEGNPKAEVMREASSLAGDLDDDVSREWLALGRRLKGKPTPD